MSDDDDEATHDAIDDWVFDGDQTMCKIPGCVSMAWHFRGYPGDTCKAHAIEGPEAETGKTTLHHGRRTFPDAAWGKKGFPK